MATPLDDDGSKQKVTVVFGSNGLLGSACMRRLSAERRWAIGVSSSQIFNSEGPSVVGSVASESGLKALQKMIGAATVEALILVASAGPDSAPAESHFVVNRTYKAFIDSFVSRTLHPRSIVFASSSLLHSGQDVGSGGRGKGTRGVSDYLRSKLDFEEYLKAVAPRFETASVTALRLGPIVGRHISAGRGNLAGDIVHALQQGTALYLRGNGSAVRGFLHLDDAVAAVFTASEVKRSGFSVRLAEGPSPVSVQEFVTKVSDITGLSVIYLSENPPSMATYTDAPTFGRGRILEHWSPRVSIEQMITAAFGGLRPCGETEHDL